MSTFPRLAPRERIRRGALLANPLFARIGLEVTPFPQHHWQRFPTVDFPDWWQSIIQRVRPYTLTSPERMGALLQSVEFVTKNDVPGAFVECGVWRGGSTMAAALAFQRLGSLRDLYLFDTFEGMPKPGEDDITYLGDREVELWKPGNAAVALEEVRAAIGTTDYPASLVRYVKGIVEETIPENAPEEISILRLDTDWYESTKHELEHLWARVQPGGVLIIDDYGWNTGARKAADEFFGPDVFLHRIDYTGRLVVKR